MTNLKKYFKDRGYNLSENAQVVKAYADAKVNHDATQEDVASAVGVTARTLRKYIAEDREAYEAYLAEFELKASGKVPSISENDLNSFVDNIIRMGTNPQSVKEVQLFIEFFGITSEDVKEIMNLKRKSLRGWLREAESIDYMNVEEMQRNLLTMDILYNQNQQSKGATAKAMNINPNDAIDQYRLMYLGALFVSLFNQTENKALLKYLSVMMRLEQIKQGRDISIDADIRKQAERASGTYEETKELTANELEQGLRDIGYTEAEIQDMLYAFKHKSNSKPVELPDKEELEQDEEQYKEQLRGYLKPHEELKLMLKGEL